MALFSDDESFVADENVAPRPKTSSRAAAKMRSKIVDDSFDLDFDDEPANDSGSDFQMSDDDAVPAPKPKAKAAPAKAKAAAKPKKPATKKQPLKPVDNQMSLDSFAASSTPDASPAPSPAPKATAGTAKSSKSNDASSQYQRLSQLEHVLKRPDTYIGSVEMTEQKMWVFDTEHECMRYRDVKIVPGLYKIFDEILVNAADNKIRDPSMDTLKVDIDVSTNTISVYNNGRGIPIEIHAKEKIYIPELIFGHLLTSSNYDDDEKKVTGGRNGFGAKVCLFWKSFPRGFLAPVSLCPPPPAATATHQRHGLYNPKLTPAV